MTDKKKRRLMIRTVILAVLMAAVAYTLYASLTKDKHAKIEVGDMAPDFVLTDMQGNKHKLSEYRGKGVFLNFWGTWCKPCEKEMPYMNNQYKAFEGQDVEILAVNLDTQDLLVKKFVDKHGLTFPILRDKTKDVMDLYGVYYLPATILVDPEGKVTDIVVGDLTEDRIRSMMESIRPK
ncbi:MAG TPA: thiol-disulfide oxidoreductase ResA [Bacillaceae bacterium]